MPATPGNAKMPPSYILDIYICIHISSDKLDHPTLLDKDLPGRLVNTRKMSVAD